MRVYGVDFTSAPGPGKAIAVASCELAGERLRVGELLRLRSFAQLEGSLRRPGPWIAGFDLPFGQPRKLIRGLGWPETWEGHVAQASVLGRNGLCEKLAMYRASRPAGDKEHLRATDRLARSLSPMKCYGVPLAKMFVEGAPRLLASGVSVLPCRPVAGEDRIAIEAYPALVAQCCGWRTGYKPSRGKPSPAQAAVRRRLVAALGGDALAARYGLRVELSSFCAQELVADPAGDLLDAVLGAVQAAWAWERRDQGFGMPPDADPVEGWIVDPVTAAPS